MSTGSGPYWFGENRGGMYGKDNDQQKKKNIWYLEVNPTLMDETVGISDLLEDVSIIILIILPAS